MNVEQGLKFICRHIRTPVFSGDELPIYFDLWPKKISSKSTENGQFEVTSFTRAVDYFNRTECMDSKICAYPLFVDSFDKNILHSWTRGGRGIVPNFLFIDLDMGRYFNDLDMLNSALMNSLNNIDIKFHGKFKPTILWSGNGYHIYLPVQLSGPSWCLGYVDEFVKLTQYPDRKLIQWAEQYLSNNEADLCHSKGMSFKNMLLRVPGSINSKNNVEVKIIQEWDGQRPFINWILRDFRNHLIAEKKKPKKKVVGYTPFINSTRWGSKK
jgi:hypothetical protein